MKKLTLVTATLMFVLTSCKETEADRVGDAQSCLDELTIATAASGVAACVAMVEGLNTKGANLIRCSSKFIEQGYMDPAKIDAALQQIENGDGANESVDMMDALAFTGGTATTDASDAVTYCEAAGSDGFTMLASLASIATTAKSLAAGDIDAGLGAIAADTPPYDPSTEAVGNAASAAYEANCTGDGGSYGAFCDQFESVVQNSGGSAGEIGQFLAQCYTAPATPGCEGF